MAGGFVAEAGRVVESKGDWAAAPRPVMPYHQSKNVGSQPRIIVMVARMNMKALEVGDKFI